MKRFLIIGLITAACGDTTSPEVNQLNLDRPVDVAFACYGRLRITGGGGDDSATAEQDIVNSAQPPKACDIRSTSVPAMTPTLVPPGQQNLKTPGVGAPSASWYALILQRGPGTVAIAQFAASPKESFNAANKVEVLDVDPLTPNKNSISVGEDPVGIVTDTLGCSAVTANAGSTDLSILDLTTALDHDGHVNIARLDVTNASGVAIRSKPSAIVAEPKETLIGDYCPSQAPGAPSPVMPKGLVYIAYPSCHLVAGVDLETGKVVTGIQFSDGGPPTVLADLNVTCPDERDATGTRTPGPRPVTLDLETDERVGVTRLVIGSENRNSVAIVELDGSSRPLSIQPIALEGPTTLGVTNLALSAVVGVGGSNGVVDDSFGRADYQFVYAVATDQTVRVMEIHSNKKECDTQVDPRLLRTFQDAATLGCLVVGDVNTPRRRAGARGPGIDLGPDQVPLAVDFVKSTGSTLVDPKLKEPAVLLGHFAIITSTTGESFVTNVDDDAYPDAFQESLPLVAPVTLVMPHQVRDAIGGRDERAVAYETDAQGNQVEKGPLCDPTGTILDNGAAAQGPRVPNSPTKALAGFVAPEKQLMLPSIRNLRCEGLDSTKVITELAFAAPPEQRDLAFPDWRALATDEQLSLVWEGTLSVDRSDSANNGPAVRESMLYVDQAGMHLRDQARPYCDAGVEPNDIVQMRGCDPSLSNADCPIGYTCYVHPQSKVSGLGACLLKTEAERLAEACKDFLTSIRRYTVARAESGELLLKTRRHELRTTPLDGCTSDTQCRDLANVAKRTASSTHPSDPTEQAIVDDRQWVCRSDSTRAPRGTMNNRCNLSCDTTAQCAAGTICVGGNEATPALDGLCMEGVVPAQACVNAPQRYELRAGEAFVFAGNRTGYVHPIIADANKVCVKDPNASPYQTSRIPLAPPACDPAADPVSGLLPSGLYEPNPCSYTVSHAENLPIYMPGTCTLADPSSEIRVRQAPAVKYRSRGMTFSIVDPTYPGDQTCITDRAGSLVNVPQVFLGYAITFRQQAGFSPLRLPITPTHPVRVLRGPTESIWVVDEGDFLSTSIQAASTRGKVFRVESDALGIVNTLQ